MQTTETEPKKRIGRKPIPLDWKLIDEFLASGSRGIEIAAYFDIEKDTLYDACVRDNGIAFSAYSAEKREKGHIPLRYKMYKKAVKDGNITALLHLAKHRLNEWDQKEEVATAPLQKQIDSDHENMKLKAQLQECLDKLALLESNVNQSEAR